MLAKMAIKCVLFSSFYPMWLSRKVVADWFMISTFFKIIICLFSCFSTAYRQTHPHISRKNMPGVPSQLTLPQRHLSLGRARWWMQAACACALFSASPLPFPVWKQVVSKWSRKTDELKTVLNVFVCTGAFSFAFKAWFYVQVSHPVYHSSPVSSPHSYVHRFAAEMLSAALGSTCLASCLAFISAGGRLWDEW